MQLYLTQSRLLHMILGFYDAMHLEEITFFLQELSLMFQYFVP